MPLSDILYPAAQFGFGELADWLERRRQRGEYEKMASAFGQMPADITPQYVGEHPELLRSDPITKYILDVIGQPAALEQLYRQKEIETIGSGLGSTLGKGWIGTEQVGPALRGIAPVTRGQFQEGYQGIQDINLQKSLAEIGAKAEEARRTKATPGARAGGGVDTSAGLSYKGIPFKSLPGDTKEWLLFGLGDPDFTNRFPTPESWSEKKHMSSIDKQLQKWREEEAAQGAKSSESTDTGNSWIGQQWDTLMQSLSGGRQAPPQLPQLPEQPAIQQKKKINGKWYYRWRSDGQWHTEPEK